MLHALTLLPVLLVGALTQPSPDAIDAYLDDGRGDAASIASEVRTALGPQGAADAISARYPHELQWARTGEKNGPRIERLRTLIDEVTAQKDGWASGLAWHTDLAAAEREAKQKKLPILSLRLLGRLDEDLSCANSRFFRTLLYPDPAVQQQMKGFVLHWQTVRPAPKLTIDMGDGRVLTTTITGNSAHLVLDADGFVVDAIPGLVSPRVFVDMLTTAASTAQVPRAQRATLHRALREREAAAWMPFTSNQPLPLVGKSARAFVAAREAAPLAVTKAIVEMPVVRALQRQAAITAEQARASSFVDDVAHRFVEGVPFFSPQAERLIARKLAPGQDLQLVLGRLRSAVARDTALNSVLLHDAVRSWLADGVDGGPVVQQRLYDELFLTPSADPWLGLHDVGGYVGVDGGGMSRDRKP